MAKRIKKKEGRPTVMTKEVISKLEVAFSNGATDLQACFIAGISRDSLYNYINLNPDFSDRKEALKDMIKYQAKAVIKAALIDEKQKIETAKWYLERKDKDFKQKADITSDDKPISILANVSGNNIDPKDNSSE